MNALCETLCNMGFNEFLLDIGANIGLTTIQNSSRFKSIFAYEPNPIAFAVLTANCYQLDKKHLHLFPFGIGARDEVLDLRFPMNNLGGGSALGEGNFYQVQAVEVSDGFLRRDQADCGVLQVPIKCGSLIFGEVFETLAKSAQRMGVIKIDAEGYELTILKQLAASRRDGIEFVAVFENWSPTLNKQTVVDIFAGQGFIYKLEWNMSGLSKIRQIVQLAMRGERFTVVDSYRDLVGTVIYSTKPLH